MTMKSTYMIVLDLRFCGASSFSYFLIYVFYLKVGMIIVMNNNDKLDCFIG